LSLNRNEKQAVVTDVAAQVARSQTLALAEYRGMTVAHLDVLRKTAREKGVYLHVLKNSLARRAVAGTPFEVASASMVGPLIYGFSEDAVAAAKVISDFAKTNDKLIVKAGAHAGQALDAKGVQSLASIPSKEVLLSQLLGLMQSPIARIARVLAMLAEKRGAGAPAEAAPAEAAPAAEAPAADVPPAPDAAPAAA
jgi:large subunit ribosomal protein L10